MATPLNYSPQLPGSTGRQTIMPAERLSPVGRGIVVGASLFFGLIPPLLTQNLGQHAAEITYGIVVAIGVVMSSHRRVLVIRGTGSLAKAWLRSGFFVPYKARPVFLRSLELTKEVERNGNGTPYHRYRVNLYLHDGARVWLGSFDRPGQARRVARQVRAHVALPVGDRI